MLLFNFSERAIIYRNCYCLSDKDAQFINPMPRSSGLIYTGQTTRPHEYKLLSMMQVHRVCIHHDAHLSTAAPYSFCNT